MSDTIWLEKYRPQTLEEVQGNDESINTLKNISTEGNIPNMILVVRHFINNPSNSKKIRDHPELEKLAAYFV